MAQKDDLAVNMGPSSAAGQLALFGQSIFSQNTFDTMRDSMKNALKFELIEKDENDQPGYRSVSLYRAVTAEFWASAVFVFLSCGAAVASGAVISLADSSANDRVKGGGASLLVIALSFGLCITVLVYAVGHLSGGHINSAVTFSFMIVKKTSIHRGASYIFAQLLGSIVGAAMLKAVLPPAMAGTLGVTTVSSDMNRGSAVVLEAILTSVLLFTVFSAIDSSRVGEMHNALAPLAIGLAVFVCHLLGVPFTGCSINPSRSFGPAVVTGIWKDQWVYWVGPILGATITAILYQVWFKRPDAPTLPAKPVHIKDKALEDHFAYRRHLEEDESTAI